MKFDTKSLILGILIGILFFIISFLLIGEVYVDIKIGNGIEESKAISI